MGYNYTPIKEDFTNQYNVFVVKKYKRGHLIFYFPFCKDLYSYINVYVKSTLFETINFVIALEPRRWHAGLMADFFHNPV